MQNQDKEWGNDRILVLKPIEGKSTKSSTGLVDNKLFTGENNLHALMDEQSCLWRLQYDHGGLPPVLKQRWTTFGKLHAAVKDYMKKRNIEVIEVRDNA